MALGIVNVNTVFPSSPLCHRRSKWDFCFAAVFAWQKTTCLEVIILQVCWPGCLMNGLLRRRIWPSFSPSCRLYPPGRIPYGTESSRKPCVLGCRPRRRTIQVRFGTNPAVPRDGCPVARPPRLSPPEADNGGQARPSSWFHDSNS